ncbi:MAG: hypothetical protein IJ946_08785 [Clostridia bacterium]|nr:hypothetical protein [Clostridia bacterium]
MKKYLSYLLIFIIALGAAYYLANDNSANSYDFSSYIPSYVPSDEEAVYGPYYNQLNDFQKKVYSSFFEAVKNADDEVVLENVKVDDFNTYTLDALIALQYDHPEFFWFRCGYDATLTRAKDSDTGTITAEPIYFNYVSSLFDHKGKLEKLNTEVDRVAALAREHSGDVFEQMVFVHDYLIENAIYDTKGLEEYEKTEHSPSNEYIFSAYGCLINKKTVCAGYAKAFQLIMNMLGYECSYVSGDAGGAHAWNCVYIDGKGYYVDVTWDDYDLEKEAPFYNYAFITTKELNKTHQVTMPFKAPVCNDTKYNYFVKKSYYLDSYQIDRAKEILSMQANKNAAHIKFSSFKDLTTAYYDLFKSGRFKSIAGFEDFKYLTYNKEHCTISVYR